MSSTQADLSGTAVSHADRTFARPLTVSQTGARLESIDLMRGLVMVLMALDHVRDFFANAHFDVLDPAITTVPWYLTRWVTHLCAPTFVFLAGVSAYLMSQRTTAAQLSRFLLKRGLWLVLLEFTVVNFAWLFSLSYATGLFMQVIWAIGISMICLAALIRLPRAAVFAFAFLTIAGHNLLDGIGPAEFGSWAPLWNVLHVKGITPFGFVSYPVIPWIGVMALGYAMGSLYDLGTSQRRGLLTIMGLFAVLAFLVLRSINGYGDLSQWTSQPTAVRTLFAFFNIAKYPPSLLYLLLTLGIAFLLLAAFERHEGHSPCASPLRRTDPQGSECVLRHLLSRALLTFGRVPLFFYILHLYMAHFAAGIVGLLSGRGTQMFTTPLYRMPADWGFGIAGVYLTWMIVLLAAYPLCRWFAEVKRRRSDWWLAYL